MLELAFSGSLCTYQNVLEENLFIVSPMDGLMSSAL